MPIPTLPFVLAPTIILFIALVYPLYKTTSHEEPKDMAEAGEKRWETEASNWNDGIMENRSSGERDGKEPKINDHQDEESEEHGVCSSTATTSEQKEVRTPPEALPVSSERMNSSESGSMAETSRVLPDSGWLAPSVDRSMGEHDGNLQATSPEDPRTNDYQAEVEVEEPEEHDVCSSTATLSEQKDVQAPPPVSSDLMTTSESGSMPETSRVLPDNGWPSPSVERSMGEHDGNLQTTSPEDPRTNDFQAEVEVEEPEENDVYLSTAPPVSSELMKNDPTISCEEPKNADVAGEETSETDASTRNDGIVESRPTGERDGKEPRTNDYQVEEEEHDVDSSTATMGEQKEVKTPPVALPFSSDLMISSESGSMAETSRVLPDFGWPAPSVDRAAAERDGKPQLTSLGTSQHDHGYSAFVSPDSNKLSSTELVDKIAEPFISQPEKKPLEQKAEPNPCEVMQSNSESHQPTGIPEATTPDIYNNDGTNESPSRSMLNCMKPVGDEPKSMTANLDQSATDKKEYSEEAVKSVNAPFLDNSLPVEMATNIKQGTSDTEGDCGAQTSMPAPPPRGMLLLRLKVNLPGRKITFLEFCDGDCIQTVAERWCRVWKVPNGSTQRRPLRMRFTHYLIST